mmetsp:Transcript_9590/g.13276  ORF Transcript_9590/g.13276 Transcript_9590/m.13276 type:complete len:88 (-) Transcript_9590:67-330(-)
MPVAGTTMGGLKSVVSSTAFVADACSPPAKPRAWRRWEERCQRLENVQGANLPKARIPDASDDDLLAEDVEQLEDNKARFFTIDALE